ncbi:SPOR domain-containing protein [Comamonas flocculans]|uniref:Sporulation protein n=1 Tax=Comamonas flocculans TaxID=2597701 RepID=A0A5B8RXE8_9BURK|nr:SPOR domain-containing protein [Comamonas flocculans]QEA12915.1 sporulation protein [Comamonas flocculans]
MGKARRSGQRGGTFAGLVLGVVVGLGIAFVVAAYVSKVPVPFLSSGSRLADQDAREAERNKDWNPNAGLVTGAGGKPAPAPAPQPAGHETTVPAASDDPLGDLARAKAQGGTPESTATAAASASAAAGPTGNYYIQAGAFRAPDEADAQRAQLAMLGWEARVSEGQQNGRAVYRVRIGPFARRDDADQLKGKLDGAGITSILVRVSASR